MLTGGRVTSLFPNNSDLTETNSPVKQTIFYKFTYNILAITLPVIQNAKQVFVVAIRNTKRRVYEEVLFNVSDIGLIHSCAASFGQNVDFLIYIRR